MNPGNFISPRSPVFNSPEEGEEELHDHECWRCGRGLRGQRGSSGVHDREKPPLKGSVIFTRRHLCPLRGVEMLETYSPQGNSTL